MRRDSVVGEDRRVRAFRRVRRKERGPAWAERGFGEKRQEPLPPSNKTQALKTLATHLHDSRVLLGSLLELFERD